MTAELGCQPWEIGPCQLCAAPIHRYGHRGYLACHSCRMRDCSPRSCVR